jgi:hypothetical protein
LFLADKKSPGHDPKGSFLTVNLDGNGGSVAEAKGATCPRQVCPSSRELLGHESLETLEHYAHLTIGDLKKTHARCPPRERES